VSDILPKFPLIGGGGKIPDMIWLANWGFGGEFKIITNIRPPGFITAGPSFQVRRSGAPEPPSPPSASRRGSSYSLPKNFAAFLCLEKLQRIGGAGVPAWAGRAKKAVDDDLRRPEME
jgi:hypothetical protein